jgi:hypothetical protein
VDKYRKGVCPRRLFLFSVTGNAAFNRLQCDEPGANTHSSLPCEVIYVVDYLGHLVADVGFGTRIWRRGQPGTHSFGRCACAIRRQPASRAKSRLGLWRRRMAMEINFATLRDKTDEELIALADDLAFQLDLVGDEQCRRIVETFQHKRFTLNSDDPHQSTLLIIPQSSSQ